MRSMADAVAHATVVRVDATVYEVEGSRLVEHRHSTVGEAKRHVGALLRERVGCCVVGEAALSAVSERLRGELGGPPSVESNDTSPDAERERQAEHARRQREKGD